MSTSASQQFDVFNILPFHVTRKDAHQYEDEFAALECTAVQDALRTLQDAGTFRGTPLRYFNSREVRIDAMDWLGHLFGFQRDNVRNQQEHVVLLLANHNMSQNTEISGAGYLHQKLLENYREWCSFLGIRDCLLYSTDARCLLYPCLYLLIWGEAANLRFMPECLCFIFHNMAGELNRTLQQLDPTLSTGDPDKLPFSFSDDPNEHSFLTKVIKPFYKVLRAEANASRGGTAPHSTWRNYDDMNEFFWSRHCFEDLGKGDQWLDQNSDYFMVPHVPTGGQEGQSRMYSRQGSWAQSRRNLRRQNTARNTTTTNLQLAIRPQLGQSNRLGQITARNDKTTTNLQLAIPSQRSQSNRVSLDRRFEDAHITSTSESKRNDFNVPVRRRNMGFKRGFVEQRSFWNAFHSLPRLWVANILILQAMITIGFRGGGFKPWNAVNERETQVMLLNILITWAVLRLLQALLYTAMQLTLISRRTWHIALRMALKVVVAVAWTVIFSILNANLWKARVNGWSNDANQKLFQVLEAAAVFAFPELLVVVFYFLPCITNWVERSNNALIAAFTWWFHTRTFVGRGMHQGTIETFQYTLFWIVVLSFKYCFSYYFQVRPLVDPTRMLLTLNLMNYRWHEFFSNHNRFIVALLWMPVVLIYFMDVQIWYAVFSSIVGVMLGLRARIGEIRTMLQFKLRFPYFASAMTFNLLPVSPHETGPLQSKLRRMIRQIMNQYGCGKHYVNLFKFRHEEGQMFSCVWNTILLYLREEDLLDDQEKDLMEIPDFEWIDPGAVIQWPCVLLSNELSIALHPAEKAGGGDADLWQKIENNVYRESAVKECFYGLKHLLTEMLKMTTNAEHARELFKDIELKCRTQEFTRDYNVEVLVEVQKKVKDLIEILLKRPKREDYYLVTVALEDLLEVLFVDLPKNQLQRRYINLQSLQEEAHENLQRLQKDAQFYRYLQRLKTIISTRETLINVPKNLEARRRITFFSNSLFMDMPPAPKVENMHAFSVLTPYFNEDVLYSSEQITELNEDGISIKFYLQTIYPDEWINYKQRMERLQQERLHALQARPLSSGKNEEDSRTRHGLKNLDLRLWASDRGQTLCRTVRGMMYYQRALEMLAHLERHSARSHDRASASTSSMDAPIGSDFTKLNIEARDRAAALLKFAYIIACQVYGKQKKEGNPQATDIQYLMQEYPTALRVAYVDEEHSPHVDVDNQGMANTKHYSILVKYDTVTKQEVQIYRIELPGPFILGEGKPENQNQAIIFTRGDGLQAIDMNQDFYFEEALKIRNLLQEFGKMGSSKGNKPKILGMREHVFTGSVSSLGSFMSGQETSFVTLGQRVLANPLKIRMHYGHPDMFDRLWFLVRGGISKASKAINASEDIFAGFNCTLRRGSITHHEYTQGGKGRDVGLNQILQFEAKISAGNGEQMLSRDVYRLGHRLDFFRMLSFYHTTVGFYLSNLLVVLTIYVFLWGRVYLALSGIEEQIALSLRNPAFAASLNQQFLVQMGLFTALPMVVENSLELGVTEALWSFMLMQLQLCSVFFTFSLGTKVHYFGRTLLHGGAKYRATGRGFVVKRVKFASNYRVYARSHFMKAIELIILLIIYQTYGETSLRNTGLYALLTFSSWFLAISWITAPFLFNPSGFDWLQTVDDFDDFKAWIWHRRELSTNADQSWEVWWNEEVDHVQTTGFWGKAMEITLSLRFFLIQYGVVYTLNIAAHNKSILVYLLSWISIVVVIVVYMVVARARDKYSMTQHGYYRAIQCFVVFFIAAVIHSWWSSRISTSMTSS